MIGIDWGTTSFRAYRIASDGTVRDRRTAHRGILNVPDGRFGQTLRDEIGLWLAAGETRVLLSGMIGSRQGWLEAPYLPCPAGAAELAAAVIDVPFNHATIKLVPGLSGVDGAGVAEVMRGEETQIIGAMANLGGVDLVCLPGTHAKWVRVEDGRIISFTTHMTGEVYAALREHTILGRMMRDTGADGPAFDAGVRRSGQPGGLLHHIFGVRSLALAGSLSEADGPAYLSGILIGHELRAGLSEDGAKVVHVIGAADLVTLYARAIALCGGEARCHDGDAAERGLAIIGAQAKWD